LPEDAGEDSYSVLPLMLGEEGERPIREATVHHSGGGMFAVRKGRWKLILGQDSGGGQTDRKVETEGQLYDMEEDAGETMNVYTEHPEIVAELTDLLDKYEREGRSAPVLR
jgi:arylsulfatase A-like enzyme